MVKDAIKSPHAEVALIGQTVIISSSEKQLERIKKVADGELASLESLDEYKFFRHRYPLSAQRTGYIFLSNSCVRRWLSPRMRIAAARRISSIQALKSLTAQQINSVKHSDILTSDAAVAKYHKFLLGDITLMNISTITEHEFAAYNNWRKRNQSQWKALCAIGLSFDISDSGITELDLSVIPLKENNYYRHLTSFIGDGILSPQASPSFLTYQDYLRNG